MAQAIGQVIEIFGIAAFFALATALGLTWLGQRLLPAGPANRFVLPCAVSIAYFSGYATLPRAFATFSPQTGQAWAWLPYLGLLAAITAASPPPTTKLSIRVILLTILATLSAVALSPIWSVYGFSRIPLAVFLSIYLLAVGFPLQQSPPHSYNRQSLYLLLAISILNTLAIGAIYSTRHAQLAALFAAALTGISIALRFRSKAPDLALSPLAPLFATLVGGIAWLACVEPDPPKPILLAIPLLSWAILALHAMLRLPSAPPRIG